MVLMRGTTHVVAACALVLACACGTGDTRVDPGDLELRDLLGISPETAGRWDGDQRAAALRVFDEALADGRESINVELLADDTIDARVARSLGALDAKRFADGDAALGLVRVSLSGDKLAGATRPAPTLRAFAGGKGSAPDVQLELTETWHALPQVSHEVLAALATDAGAVATDKVVVVPAPRLTVIASYVASAPPRMLVNPVLLAAIDEHAETLSESTANGSPTTPRADDSKPIQIPSVLAGNGNPYSFFGSIAECAYQQRTRCESCVASQDCVPVTSSNDGVAECATLDADGGRGYFLLCVNMALAISSVDECTADERSGCARDTDAASDLGQLANNAVFIDDPSCGTALDKCLAEIYGKPSGNYPGIGVDAGADPDPPRETNVSCGDSCDSNKSANCEFSPNCNCEGPSCGNSFSCDSSCSSSNNQNGCGDNCDSCGGDSSGGGDSGGGCGGDSGSGGSSSGGGCGGGDSGGGSCGSCSGDSSSGGGSSGGGCGGGSCGGGDSGSCGSCSGGGSSSSSSSGGGCGGGGGGGCQVVKRAPSPIFAVGLSLSWALLPVPLAAILRRRAKRKSKRREDDDRAKSAGDDDRAWVERESNVDGESAHKEQDGCLEERNAGLTEFGRAVLRAARPPCRRDPTAQRPPQSCDRAKGAEDDDPAQESESNVDSESAREEVQS